MNFEICFQILSMLLADNVFKGISEELALTYKVSVKNTLLKVVCEICFCNCDQSDFDSVTEKSSLLTPGGSLWFLCTHHRLQQHCGSFCLPEPILPSPEVLQLVSSQLVITYRDLANVLFPKMVCLSCEDVKGGKRGNSFSVHSIAIHWRDFPEMKMNPPPGQHFLCMLHSGACHRVTSKQNIFVKIAQRLYGH